MPCGCERMAPCQVPQLVPLASYSESHAIVLDLPYSQDWGVSPVTVLVGTALLFVALSRHFRSQPLCVLNLAGRAAAAAAPGSRPKRAVRRPIRLVLSARERDALNRIREAARRAVRPAAAPARLPLPVRLAPPPRPARS